MYQNVSPPDLTWKNEDKAIWVLIAVQKKEWYCLAGKMVSWEPAEHSRNSFSKGEYSMIYFWESLCGPYS